MVHELAPDGREHPGEETEFSWLPDGDVDAAGRAFAFAIANSNMSSVADGDSDEDSDEGSWWASGGSDFEWPEDIADAPGTTDAAPEPPRTPEQPTISILRMTPSKDTTRELLDIRIVPSTLGNSG